MQTCPKILRKWSLSIGTTGRIRPDDARSKVVRTGAYGFRTLRAFEVALSLTLGGNPKQSSAADSGDEAGTVAE